MKPDPIAARLQAKAERGTCPQCGRSGLVVGRYNTLRSHQIPDPRGHGGTVECLGSRGRPKE